MATLVKYVLLGAIPGLMFCVIPVHGMPFRFSWQLISIWLAAVIFACWLSSWWWRMFFLAALLQVIVHGPMIISYITLMLIGIFLGAAEGFRRIPTVQTLNAIRLAGLILGCWILLQAIGMLPACSLGVAGAGPFNRNAASVFLALCLPAYLGHAFKACKDGAWWLGCMVVAVALMLCESTTGILTALAVIGSFALLRIFQCQCWMSDFKARAKRPVMIALIVMGMTAWFFLRIEGPRKALENSRWQVWRHVLLSFHSECFGRGLASFQELFPAMVSGDHSLSNYRFHHAHNEYLQVAFEMGVHSAVLLMAYMVCFFSTAWICRDVLSFEAMLAVAGMAGLAVSCMGWHTFHIAPLALLGAAWLGMGRREVL